MNNSIEIWFTFSPWWRVFFPFAMDEEGLGDKHFVAPHFSFHYYKNKPCQTKWIYDWMFDFGYLHIWKKA